MIEIRKAGKNDFAQILLMQKEWEKENITYGYVEDKEENLLKYIGDYFLVAEKDGKVIGYMLCEIKENDKSIISKTGNYIEINDLYINKPNRKKGVGKMLLEKIEEIAKENNINQIQLYSAVKDIKRTITFYENSGFKSWYIRMFKDI